MSEPRYLVSVVIPAFKRSDLLRKAVESLLLIDLPPGQWEAIVVDGSPDDQNERIVNEVAARAPFRLRCVRKEPEGPGPSRNLGVALTTGEFIAFMDSDCLATAGWLRAGLDAFRDDIGIIQGRTLPDPGGVPTKRTYYVRVEKETPFYETANVFYRRTAFEQSGGFPKDLHPRHEKHMGGEDVVAAWTVIRKGWKTGFCPEALVYHALVELSLLHSLFIKHHFVVPWLVGRFPELRRFMYARYFLDRAQAFIAVAFAGAVLAVSVHWIFWALGLPYVVMKFTEPATARGILRLARLLVHMIRDISTFGVLLAGSLRFRCFVL
jgi:glycosyltransferase involved in cell wall biosynthesis